MSYTTLWGMIVQAQGSTLERAEMILARLTGNASLLGANLIMADLRWAQMAGANFREAQLTGADLHQAQLDGADLRLALLQQANLTRAQMRDVILGGTQMQGSNLAGANMQGARLNNTQLQEANLAGAQMRRTKLNGVRMQKTRLSGAQLQEATLYGTLLSGSPGLPNRLFHTNFSWSKNVFGALRFIDLRSAVFSHNSDWRNIFLDGTTRYSPYFANRMGTPCQWTKQILSDEEFFGRWRGWTEASPRFLSGIVDYWTLYGPKEWRHVTPIPPPEGCKWKTGPMPVWHYGGR